MDKRKCLGKGKVLLVGGESMRVVGRVFVVCSGFYEGWTSSGNSMGLASA